MLKTVTAWSASITSQQSQMLLIFSYGYLTQSLKILIKFAEPSREYMPVLFIRIIVKLFLMSILNVFQCSLKLLIFALSAVDLVNNVFFSPQSFLLQTKKYQAFLFSIRVMPFKIFVLVLGVFFALPCMPFYWTFFKEIFLEMHSPNLNTVLQLRLYQY